MKNFISLGLIAVSVALFFLYIKPEYTAMTVLQAKKDEYENVLAKSKDLASLRDSLLNQYNSISPDDKAKLEHMIPENFDSVKLVSDLNTVAARYAMVIKGVQIRQAQETSNQDRSDTASTMGTLYKTGTITFTVTGTYPNFLNFLRTIEAGEELVDIRSLTVGSSRDTSATSGSLAAKSAASSNLDFQVGFDTYYIH